MSDSSEPKIQATHINYLIQDPDPQNSEAIVEVELNNGRRLFIDDWGIVDRRDLSLDEDVEASAISFSLVNEHYGYISWDEIIEALDKIRAAHMN